jgi:hypothetical protein
MLELLDRPKLDELLTGDAQESSLEDTETFEFDNGALAKKIRELKGIVSTTEPETTSIPMPEPEGDPTLILDPELNPPLAEGQVES